MPSSGVFWGGSVGQNDPPAPAFRPPQLDGTLGVRVLLFPWSVRPPGLKRSVFPHPSVMQLTRAISAGLLDSGFASLATFGVGLYAAHALEAEVLGLYALTFAAFTMASMVSHQGLFVPAEAWAVSRGRGAGTRILLSSLKFAPIPALAVPLVFLLPGLVAPIGSGESVLPILALTGAAAAVVSPVQDHVRRVLHLSGSSSKAVAVSVIQAVAVVAFLGIAHNRFPVAAVPFGVLASANVVSLGLGIALAAMTRPQASTRSRDSAVGRAVPASGPSLAELTGSGRWLLTAQASTEVGAFLAAALLARLGSMEMLGFAEAARILGRPVLVLMTGLAAVLGPRLMSAGADGKEAEASELRSVFLWVALGASALYAGAFGWNHSLNPFVALVPHAFVIPGLVLATVLASAVRGIVLPRRFEAIGGGRESGLARIDFAAAVVQTSVATMAGFFQGFTLVAGSTAFAFVRLRGLRRLTQGMYAKPCAVGGEIFSAAEGTPFDPLFQDPPCQEEVEVARAR